MGTVKRSVKVHVKLTLFLATFSFCSSTLYAVTVTLGGSKYSLNAHPRVFFDGPNGSIITSRLRDPDGTGPLLAPKALKNNPAWSALAQKSQSWYKLYDPTDLNNTAYYQGGGQAAMFALYWYSDNTQKQYHDAALYLINNVDLYLPTYCDETVLDCVSGGGTGYSMGSYGIIYYVPNWIFAYELMRDEMSEQQRTAFADKMLNDIPAFGGIGESAFTSCTNPSFHPRVNVIVTGTLVTASAPLFGPKNPIQLNDWVVLDAGQGYAEAHIVSIQDETRATISKVQAYAWNGYKGTISYRPARWQVGDCGALWTTKHGRFVPQAISQISGKTAYPTSGGVVWAPASNNSYGTYQGYIAAFLSLIDDDRNALDRSGAQLSGIYDDYRMNVYEDWIVHSWTGFHFAGSNYGTERPAQLMKIPAMLAFSTDGVPPDNDDSWIRSYLRHLSASWLPSCAAGESEWGQGGFAITSFGSGFQGPENLQHIAMAYALERNTPDGTNFNWTLQHRFSTCSVYGNTPGGALTWNTINLQGASIDAANAPIYAFTDPEWPMVDSSVGIVTGHVFNTVVATSDQKPQSVLISRTGYASALDTLIMFYGLYENYRDHNVPSQGYGYPGTYTIFKGNFLLAFDGQQNGTYRQVFNDYMSGGEFSDYLEVGGSNHLNPAGSPMAAIMPRSNVDSGKSRFAYAMVDSRMAYTTDAAVRRANRQLIDFKAGGQFVVVYDDIETSRGGMKRTFLHYPNNFGASSDVTRGTTTLSRRTVESINPGISKFDSTQISTRILSPAGDNSIAVYTDRPDGSWPGGNGSTFRVSVCASQDGSSCDANNRYAEFLIIHHPAVGTNNPFSLPATMLLKDENWTGVEIDGTSPKIALFSRKGELRSSVAFTAAHFGSAQIMIAGLELGTYSVTVDGRQRGLGHRVLADDNTLYLEGGPGRYSILQSAKGPK